MRHRMPLQLAKPAQSSRGGNNDLDPGSIHDRSAGLASLRAGETMRVDIKAILKDPVLRRRLTIRCIVAIQAREGVQTTLEQAGKAYDKVKGERRRK